MTATFYLLTFFQKLKRELTLVEAEELSADFFRFEDSVRNLKEMSI